MNQYEAMFLFDPTFGSSMEDCEAEIRRLMERAEGEIIVSGKWDERRLAYRINGRKRGVYVLVYFKAPTTKIAQIERDVQLAENILRVLIVRAEDISRETMDRAIAGARTGTDEEGGDSRDRYGSSDRRTSEKPPAKSTVAVGSDQPSGDAKKTDPA